MSAKLFGKHIFQVRLVADYFHKVHSAIADIAHHCNAIHICQFVKYGGITLWKHICTCDFNMIVGIAESEIHSSVFQQVFFEMLFLAAYPGQWQTCSNKHRSLCKVFFFQFVSNSRKGKYIVILIFKLVCDKFFMSCTY